MDPDGSIDVHTHGSSKETAMQDQTPPLLLKVEEAARLLGLGRSKVFQLLSTGELPRVHIGRSVRVRRTDLEQWVEERAAETRDEVITPWRAG